MAEQKQVQKKILPALSSYTSEGNLSFVILLMLMSLVKTRLKSFKLGELIIIGRLIIQLDTQIKRELKLQSKKYQVFS